MSACQRCHKSLGSRPVLCQICKEVPYCKTLCRNLHFSEHSNVCVIPYALIGDTSHPATQELIGMLFRGGHIAYARTITSKDNPLARIEIDIDDYLTSKTPLTNDDVSIAAGRAVIKGMRPGWCFAAEITLIYEGKEVAIFQLISKY